MKSFFIIATFALVVVSVSAAPTAQSDKEKVEMYAANVLKFGEDLLKEFPAAPASKSIKPIIEHVQFRIKEIKSQPILTNIVDTVAYLALDNEKLAQLARHLRHPEQKPQNDQTKVLTYAKNVLTYAESLHKEFPNAPEVKDIKQIIAHIKFRIEIIESQVKLSNIVDTIAYLVLDNEKLAQIGKKPGKPI